MILILARHGRTALNADGRVRGHLDPPLDDEGHAEAQRLAEAVVAYEPTRVLTSPLTRAVQTGAAIAAHCGVPAAVDQRLIDRDYGEWDGHRIDDVVTRWGSVDAAPGVEPVLDVVRRTQTLLSDLAHEGEAVVLVAHDAVNRQVLADLDPTLGPPDDIAQPTACWNVLEHDDHGWTVLAVAEKE